MAIILDCLHILEIWFSVKHTLSIVCNHLLAFLPRCFSCSTSTSSLPAALLFFSAALPFLYSSSLKGCAFVGVPSWIGGSIGFGFVGIVTRHGGFVVVGLLDSFFDSLPCPRTVVCQISRSDDLFITCCCCCLPTPMALASGGSPMFPLVVHQPASPSIWPAVQSLRRGLSTNPGATMWVQLKR